jgi:hypothetical protein
LHINNNSNVSTMMISGHIRDVVVGERRDRLEIAKVQRADDSIINQLLTTTMNSRTVKVTDECTGWSSVDVRVGTPSGGGRRNDSLRSSMATCGISDVSRAND